MVLPVSVSIRNTVKYTASPTPVPRDAGGLKNRMDESTNTGTLASSQGLRRPQRVRVRSDR